MTLVNGFPAAAKAQATTPHTDKQPSAKDMVQKLGSDNSKERDQAQKDLVKLGAAAVEEVTAGLKSKDSEIASRCEAILKELQAAGVQMASASDKQLLWSVKMTAAPAGGVAVAKGVVYVVSTEGKLLAVDLKTGQEKWKAEGPFDPLAPLTWGDFVYVSDKKSNHIVAFDTTSSKDNKEVWRTKQAFGIPVVGDGVIYAGNQDGLVAMDAKTGETKWQFDKSKVVGTMVVKDNVIYAIGTDQKVHALSAKDGSETWCAKDFGSVLMTLAGSGDLVLAMDFKALHGLSVKDGSEKWSFSVAGEVQRFANGAIDIQPDDPPAQMATRNFYIGQTQRPLCVAEGTVYLWMQTRLVAMNAKTGQEDWKLETLADPAKRRKAMKFPIGIIVGGGRDPREVDYSCSMSNGLRPVAFADGIATVGLNEGVLAINTKTRQKEWSLITNPPAGRPTIVDGVLFIGLSNNPVAMTATTMPAEKRLCRACTRSNSNHNDAEIVEADIIDKIEAWTGRF
jgi:outer membrane protein assembly factor BamB